MIKQYKFAICDDDIQFCNKIKSYIIEYYGENKVEISIFNSGEDFIKSKVKYDFGNLNCANPFNQVPYNA